MFLLVDTRMMFLLLL